MTKKHSPLILPETAETMVLLDSARMDAENRASYLFAKPSREIVAFTADELAGAFKAIERLSKTKWLVGYVRYEVGAFIRNGQRAKGQSLKAMCKKQKADDPSPLAISPPSGASKVPLLWFGVYEKPQMMERPQFKQANKPIIHMPPLEKYIDYTRAIATIKDELARGNTYQVNYTFDMEVHASGGAGELFPYLRRNQKTPYCALIKNKYEEILSFSPELFFRREGDRIVTTPMKGTAARATDRTKDAASKRALKHDVKNRAENLMIVDLLRNDVGRIAEAGSVKVPNLFEVETLLTAHQMTSTITGTIKKGVSYYDLFKALFPCGSVTGAPKIKTMDIIQKIEKGNRGVYCGAIGYIAPGKKAVFSVPIRILQKQAHQTAWQYRVGGGIVWDSKPKSEWQEALLKASFVTKDAAASFSLIETVGIKKGTIVYKRDHLARMRTSADALGIKWNFKKCEAALAVALKKAGTRSSRLRFLLNQKGIFSSEVFLLNDAPVKTPIVRFSKTVLDPANSFLYHKTTVRHWYEKTMSSIAKGQVYDEIYCNTRGEVCEGARSNVFVKIRGKMYTSPVSSGLLPGILRARLLKQGRCTEKVLTVKDLVKAEEVYCGNSVRGLVRVNLMGTDPSKGRCKR